MAGRIIAQLVIAGSGIVVRAFAEAYRQAAANAARNGGKAAAAGASEPVSKAAKQAHNAIFSETGMGVAEARQILNVEEKATREQFMKNYEHLFKVNDKKTGGSFYLQSKVVRARETLELQMQAEAAKDTAAGAAGKKGSSSAGGSSSVAGDSAGSGSAKK